MAQLDQLFSNRQFSRDALEQLEDLEANYSEWRELPDQLIALRDNLLDNQPALKLLDTEGQRSIIIIQRRIAEMLDEQEVRSPSRTNTILLRNMADFQSTFSLSVSALQSYLVTRSPTFRFEYNAFAKENQLALQTLTANQNYL